MWADTLADVLEPSVHLTPSALAVADQRTELTYLQLSERVGAAAERLKDLGVSAGGRVAVVAGNECGFLIALLAIWRLGAIAVLPNSRNPPDHVARVVRGSGAEATLLGIEHAMLTDALEGIGPIELLDDLPVRPVRTDPKHPVRPEDLAMQPYTSGSTGEPKGVLLTHGGQLHNARMMALTNLMGKGDVAVVSGPAFHANALAGIILPTLVSGGSIVFLPRFDPWALAQTVEARRATVTTVVPAMLRMLLDSGALDVHDMSSLRLIACGSAPVTRELLELTECALPGAAVVEGYGLTEGGPVVTKNPLFGPRKLGTIGLALPGVSVRLIGDAGPVPAGAIGELQVRGPGVMSGYYEQPAATGEKLLPDGWLRTGDLAYCDADGYYSFVGRADDMINVGGENVYPSEIEARILELADAAEAVVVGVPHEVKGQVPYAFVVPQAGAVLTAEQVQEHCLATGPAYAHPRRVVVLETLPLASTGKVDRGALLREALGPAAG